MPPASVLYHKLVPAAGFSFCLCLFIAHSHREARGQVGFKNKLENKLYRQAVKFFTGWTATAYHTEVDPHVNFPSLAVCPKSAFKEGSRRLVLTVEDFEAVTPGYEEVMGPKRYLNAYANLNITSWNKGELEVQKVLSEEDHLSSITCNP